MVRWLLFFLCIVPAEARVFSSLGRTQEKVVSLTFDDGPSSKFTPRVLAILKKHNIPATFFILGEKAKRCPALLRQIVEEGHCLANHSYDHRLFKKLSAEAQKAQIEKTNALLQPHQPIIQFFRPPFGAYIETTKKVATEKDLDIVLWSIDPEDWRKPPKKKMIASVMRQLHPGAILLFHDIHAGTAAALEEIIERILKEGYRFVPLTYTPCDVQSSS